MNDVASAEIHLTCTQINVVKESEHIFRIE